MDQNDGVFGLANGGQGGVGGDLFLFDLKVYLKRGDMYDLDEGDQVDEGDQTAKDVFAPRGLRPGAMFMAKKRKRDGMSK